MSIFDPVYRVIQPFKAGIEDDPDIP